MLYYNQDKQDNQSTWLPEGLIFFRHYHHTTYLQYFPNGAPLPPPGVFLSISFNICLFFVSLPPVVVVTLIRSHIAGSFPPYPLRFVLRVLWRQDFSSFFPRRLASEYLRGQLLPVIPYIHCVIYGQAYKQTSLTPCHPLMYAFRAQRS